MRLRLLAVPRLGGLTGDLAALLRRKALCPRLAALKSPQTPERDRCRVFTVLLHGRIVAVAGCSVNDKSRQLIRVAGGLS